MNEKIIEFECIRNDVKISGWMNIEDADCEHPLNFYDQQGLECGTRVPQNPYNIDNNYEYWSDYEMLKEAFQSDDLFIQNLVDFADENKTLDCGDYILTINDGAKMECVIEDASEFGEYFVKVAPFFNGEKKSDLVSFIDEHDDFDPYFGFEGDYKIINNELIFEISKDYFDEDEREEQIEIILEEFRRIFARELAYELSVFAKYGEQIEEYVECMVSDKNLFKLSQVTEGNLEEFLIDEGIIEEL